MEPTRSQLVAGEEGRGLRRGPRSSSHPNPHFHPFLPLGWTVSPRLQATARREAGRHFLKSPWGEGGGGGAGGGAKSGQATATASELAGRSAPGSSTVRKVLARGGAAPSAPRRRRTAGVPGLLHPRTCPAAPRGRPRGSTGCGSRGWGTRAPPPQLKTLGSPSPRGTGGPAGGAPGMV